MKKLILIIFSISFLTSCMEPFDQTIEYKIDKKIQPYMESFLKEAQLRGVTIDKSNLLITIDGSQNIVDGWRPGTFFMNGYQKTIVIDEWTFDLQNQNNNEILIFHELGHALLGYSKHDDSHPCMMNTEPNIYMYDKMDRSKILDDLFKVRKK